MGNEPSTSQKSRFMKEVTKRLTFVKEIKDPRFGDIQVFRRKDGEDLVMVKGKWANDEEEYRHQMKELKRRKDLDHKNLLKLLGFTEATDEFFCGDVNKITMYYEYYFHDLGKELERRRTLNVPYEEHDIWYIIESIASAAEYLQANDIFHGDINPSQILLTTKGYIKLGDHNLINNKATGYQKTLEGDYQSFLSPHQMKSMRNGENKPGDNPFKSDAYAFGMTLLEIASSRSSQLCYDWEKKRLRYDIINERLRTVQQKYSDFLTKFITSLLQDNEQNRLSFKEVVFFLSPYQEKIRDMVPFVFQGYFPDVINIHNDSSLASPSRKAPAVLENSKNLFVTFAPPNVQQITPPKGNANLTLKSPENRSNPPGSTSLSPRSPRGININIGNSPGELNSPGRINRFAPQEINSPANAVNRVVCAASPQRWQPENINNIAGATQMPVVYQQNPVTLNSRVIRISPPRVNPSASAVISERVNTPVQRVNQLRLPSPTRLGPSSPVRIVPNAEVYKNQEPLTMLPKPASLFFSNKEIQPVFNQFPIRTMGSPHHQRISSTDRSPFIPETLNNLNILPRASARIIQNSFSSTNNTFSKTSFNTSNNHLSHQNIITVRGNNLDSFENPKFSNDNSNFREDLKNLENTLTDLDKRVSAALENSKHTIQRHDDFRY